jgi:hypothetical protein
MELVVRPVDINYIAQTWPLVEGFLASALDTSDEPEASRCFNIHQVQAFITNGQWSLLVAVDKDNKIHGAASVSFINYPKQRVAFVTLGGGKFIANKLVIQQLGNICKAYGATKLQAYAKGSRVRLWEKTGFEQRTTLMEIEL